MITGTVTKASIDTKVGIVLAKKANENSHTIKKIVDGGLFSKTDLIPGLEVVAVNGKAIAGMVTKDIIDLLRAATGECSVTAKSPITAKAMKPTKSSRVGLSFGMHTTGAILITKVATDGLLANTDLKSGLEVIAVNGKAVLGMQTSDVANILRNADAGEISISAIDKNAKDDKSESPKPVPVVEKAPEPPKETAPEPPKETAPEPPQESAPVPTVITPTKIKSLIVGEYVDPEPERRTVVGTVQKDSKDTKVGIRFCSETTDGPIVIYSITEGGPFAATRLKAGYRVVSINGTSVAGKTHREAVGMIKDIVGEVTVSTTAPLNLVTGTVVKETKEGKLGLGVERIGGGSRFKVRTVTEGGLFSKTDLKAGQEILNINGIYPGGLTAKEAVNILRSAGPGPVSVVTIA